MPEPSARAVRDLALQIHRDHGEPAGQPCWGPTQDDIDEAAARLSGCKAHATGLCSCGHLAAMAARAAETEALTLSDAWPAAERNRPPLSEAAGA